MINLKKQKKSIRKNGRKYKKSKKNLENSSKKTRKTKKSKRQTLRKNYKKGGMMVSPHETDDDIDTYLRKLPNNTTSINLTNCNLEEIPNLSRFTELTLLILKDNRIRSIPPYLMTRLLQGKITTFDIRNNDLVNIYVLNLIRLRKPRGEPPNIQFDIIGLDMNEYQDLHDFGNNINLDEFEFFDCNFENCMFDNSSFGLAKFNNVSFKNAEFSNCDFNDTEFYNHDEQGNVIKIDFTQSNLQYSDFQSIDDVTLLDNADFHFAVLDHVNFTGSSLTRCNFTHAEFDETDFSSADLTDSFFGEDFLAGCDFTHADLSGVRFSGSDLSFCRFTNAVFFNTIFQDVHNIDRAIDFDINNPGVVLIQTPRRTQQPEIQTGVAYRVHNKFSTIDLDKLYDFLSRELAKDGHGPNFADTVIIPNNRDMARYITVNLAHYINTHVPLEDREKYTNDLNRIAPGLNRFDFSKQISQNKPNVSFTRLFTVMLSYIDGQPNEFMRDYVINFVAECVTAYEGQQSLSCTEGIKDRLIISLAAATMSLPEKPEYEELKQILNTNPLEMFQNFTQEWYKFRKSNPFPTKIDDLMTDKQKEAEFESRKQDYITFMKTKYTSLDVESKDVNDRIMKEAEDLKLGDMFQDYAFDETEGGSRLRKYYRKMRNKKK